MAATIPPAHFLRQNSYLVHGQLHVTEFFFEVPLDYSDSGRGKLELFARRVRRHERPPVPLSPGDLESLDKVPYLVYLEGGPGFGNREPQDHPLTRYVLGRGYQFLLLDYRGTGLSTPINVQHLLSLGRPQVQADYLKLFRADNIVRDCEAVRKCLTADLVEDRTKWSIFGQSFGGFVSLSYLSMYPRGLREVFMTGGLAPIEHSAEQVYIATYRKVIQRNEAYYRKFPADVAHVGRLVQFLHGKNGVALPGGGTLTAQRLLSFGVSFGSHGGLDTIHALVIRMVADIDQFGFLTRGTLVNAEQHLPLDTNPIYAVLHESIYCQGRGIASKWAASRTSSVYPQFYWVEDESRLAGIQGGMAYFTGEMIFPFHFQTYSELSTIADAANILADFDNWPALYDVDQLRRNEVPVYAVSFIDDMYVDFEFARETAKLVRGIQVHETNGMYHNAVRAKTAEVLDQLFRMRDDTID